MPASELARAMRTTILLTTAPDFAEGTAAERYDGGHINVRNQ
jgi:hypothetical protein